MKYALRFAVLPPALILAACGDGGVSSTPPPAETYPETANSDLRSLTANETFTSVAVKGTATGTDTDGQLTSSAATATDFSIRYDVSDNSYRLSGSGNTFSVARSALAPSSNNAGLLVSGNPDINAVAGSEGLVLLNPDRVNLTYVDIGYWNRGVRSGSTTTTNVYTFAYGVDTPNTAVPRTGSATYNTALLGVLADDTDGYYLVGTLGINANFQSGALTMTGGANGFDATGKRVAGVGNITGSGQISATENNFAGTATALGISFETGRTFDMAGSFRGKFFGPTAQEIGGALSLSGSGMNAAAAFGGTTSTLTK